MKPLIVANWKCNPPTLEETKQLFNSIKKGTKNIKNVEVVICPPFPYLVTCDKQQATSIKLGAQDVFWEKKGAYTGEVSPLMLKNLGCKYVVCGHSERRRYFGETDEMINKKIKAVLKIGLSPILCVGDKSRETKEDIKEIDSQLEKGLKGIKKSNLYKLIITYEPVWAISTTRGGVVATPEDAMEGTLYIKKILYKLLGKTLAQKIKILYGGSVNSKNINSFIYEAQMAGVLVGAASLDSQEFVKVVKAASRP